jgi:hypothetical protein
VEALVKSLVSTKTGDERFFSKQTKFVLLSTSKEEFEDSIKDTSSEDN